MNIKQIIRNFNLSILTDVDLKEPFLSIYNTLEDTFSNMKPYYKDDNKSILYYIKNNDKKIIIKYFEQVNHASLNNIIWLHLKNEINIDIYELFKVVKWYLISIHKMEICRELGLETYTSSKNDIFKPLNI